jgi:hypothetical protein
MNLSASQRVPPIDGADVLAQLRSRRSGFGLPGQFYRSAQVHGYDLNLIFYREWLFAAHTAPSHAKKLAHMRGWLRPYPWGVGRVLRYRDHDYYLLGAAIDGYLKSIRGPEADVWEMLVAEVFEPIDIHAAPTTRTREPDGIPGLVWFNAGYFPTLDDLAKIALLYQHRGAAGKQRILHRGLTTDLLAARHVLSKRDGRPLESTPPAGELGSAPVWQQPTHYRMGFHFMPYYSGQLVGPAICRRCGDRGRVKSSCTRTVWCPSGSPKRWGLRMSRYQRTCRARVRSRA